LALRFSAPIFTYKNILDKAGIFLKGNDKDTEVAVENSFVEKLMQEDTAGATVQVVDYSGYTLKELNEMLDQAVANEDYEKAARVRDEISKRG